MAALDLLYHVDWSGLEEFDYKFDENGIPLVDYGNPIGLKYNAITTAQWGLFNLGTWQQEGDESAKLQAKRCADWLVSHAQPWKHESLAWIYEFGFDLYGPYPPWISGMAQGEAVSLLLRCYQLFQDDEYIRVSHLAIKPFYFSFEKGGVSDTLADGIFFQEYPTNPPVHVLNGGIFALFGLYDYALYFEDKDARDLAYKCVETLERHWQDWDVGYWTRYDLYPFTRLASHMYQELHVRQFQALAHAFEKPMFADVANRWERQLRNPFNKSLWLGHKLYEKARLAKS